MRGTLIVRIEIVHVQIVREVLCQIRRVAQTLYNTVHVTRVSKVLQARDTGMLLERANFLLRDQLPVQVDHLVHAALFDGQVVIGVLQQIYDNFARNGGPLRHRWYHSTSAGRRE